jgi:branched-subunit amino acid ABC-type transport system permease component
MIVLQAITALLFTNDFQIFSSQFTSYQIFGGVITQVQIIIIASVIVISTGLFLLLKKTRFGKMIRAISDDEEVSKIVGIDTNKVIGRVFFIGSAIAGLSGILSGLDIGLEPTMGLSLLFKGVIAAVIGGVGNVYGGILGAFLLAFVENFGIWGISSEWKDVISFGLLIVFLLFRPQGILKK